MHVNMTLWVQQKLLQQSSVVLKPADPRVHVSCTSTTSPHTQWPLTCLLSICRGTAATCGLIGASLLLGKA